MFANSHYLTGPAHSKPDSFIATKGFLVAIKNNIVFKIDNARNIFFVLLNRGWFLNLIK